MKRLRLKFEGFVSVANDDFNGDTTAAVDDVLNNPESTLGLEPVNAEIISTESIGDDVFATMNIDPKKWIFQTVQLYEDMLEIFQELKGQLTKEEINDLLKWASENHELNVAVVSIDDLGNFSTDSYPAKLEI